MNTLAVFALAATAAIGTVLGVLLGMCWVEQRMIGSDATRRSRTSESMLCDRVRRSSSR